MKTKTIAATLAFWVLAVGVCFAADPQMGTWKLNEAKSKLPKGMGKNSTVVYSKTMLGKIKCAIDGVDAKGKATHDEWTGQFDGKDYAVTGDPMSDMRSYTKVDDHTLNVSNKMGGKVVMSGKIAVAADGKSRTVTLHGTDGKGKKISSTAVYDKQ